MRLLKRVNTVITAQLHDVVECFENPEKILKQTIREMEATLEKATESTARAIAGERQLERRLAEARTSADRSQARARDAIKNGDESTARTALARRREVETGAAALATQLAQCQTSNARLRQQLEQLRGRLAAAKGEMGVLIARQRSAEAQRQFAKIPTSGSFDLESFHYFDELSRRVDQTEAEAEALSELRFDETSEGHLTAEIERELQRLKSECEAPPE
ncbi:MAG TPA: PspA/IM30 family protein [Planctomycetaceae bacterium]|jgi:phage shock protein A|nr:PspA/IM30 family protein [Planctomycetaceae bacterium]